MNGDDKQLKSLLKQWPAPEPRPAFDQDALRRIRLARATAAESARVFECWAARLTSAWGIAAAVAAAIVIGFILANMTPEPGDVTAPSMDGVSDLLAADSVSGSYVAMLNGGGR